MGCHPQTFEYKATTCVVTHHSGLPFTGMNLLIVLLMATVFIVAGMAFRYVTR